MQTATGETLGFTLPDQLQTWKELEPDPEFQSRIRGLVLLRGGASFALPVPRSFRKVAYRIEWAETEDGNLRHLRASYQADDIMTTLTLYPSGMARFDVQRVGKPRWRPTERE